jgi:hypothetical protein
LLSANRRQQIEVLEAAFQTRAASPIGRIESPATDLLHFQQARDVMYVNYASARGSHLWFCNRGRFAYPDRRKSMSLTFPNHSRSYDRTRQAVRFWGYDTSIEYSFFVTVGALKRVEPHLRLDEEGFLGAFDANRDLIFQTAATVHSQRGKSRYELVGSDFS